MKTIISRASSFSNVNICWFSLSFKIVKLIFLGFELLVIIAGIGNFLKNILFSDQTIFNSLLVFLQKPF